MKKTIICLLFILPFFSKAQSAVSDSAQIRETVLNYVEGFFTGDSGRVAKAAHPELVKRIVQKRNQYKIANMTAEQLVMAAKNAHMNNPKPDEPFMATVTIYDIDRENATVKAVTNKMPFFDYIQLAKINGAWKIINVLWAYMM